MGKTATLQNFNLPLSLDPATVIHANKFSRAEGAISFFVLSTLYTDLVFRLEETNDDIKIYIKNLDLPIYSGRRNYSDNNSKHHYWIYRQKIKPLLLYKQ